MSHSTHSGFSGPPATAFSGVVSRFICDGPPLFLLSFTVGVGKRCRTHVANPSPLVGLAPLRL